MKFFTKLFLCVLLVLTAALSFAEYYTVSVAFQSAISRQTEETLQQHQLVKYAIQLGHLVDLSSGDVNEEAVQAAAEETAESLSVSLTLEIADESVDTNTLHYRIREATRADGQTTQTLVVTSGLSQSGYSLILTTEQDITDLFQESEQLQRDCQRVFLAVAAAGALLTLLLSWLLTRPIKALERTSRAFARGDYSARLEPRSRDEIGDLTRSYNAMADTIQEKIGDLELAVRQREDFVASFAHEIKTPMTSVIGYADTLYQNALPPEQVQEAAGYILNEGLRLEALSFKLLELITLDKQTFLLEEMEAEPLLLDVQQTAQTGADKRGVTLIIQGEPGRIRVEYDLFKTLLLNLIDNALKSGGSRVEVTGQRRGRVYSIQVEDNGRGIPEEELSRITEAFYMVDKSRSRREHGAGLGLALCDRIAKIHGTNLDFDSVEGVGTTV
ncbi:MAG: HAMP domain-containing histidine kinase [Oscillospiraceae bacterium]|nr:HAMP domain-containing histidine kinase [Oscillospiraceae bacterium]